VIARMSPVVLTVVSTRFACGMTPLFAQTEVGLTLDQALTEALVQNPSLAVERHEIGIAAGTLRQARLYPLNPELELEGSAGRGRGRGGEDARRSLNGQGIGLSQTIWLRGQRGFRIQAAEAGVDRAAAGVQNVEREVIGETLQAFGEILVAQERLALARDLVALATDVRGSAVKLFEADAVPQLDVLRAEVELTKAQNRVVAEERALTTAQRALALLLARPTNQAIRAEAPLSLPLPSGELASLQQTALERRPDLVGARAAVRAAEAELALVRAERFFPEMRVGLKYDQAQEFDSTNRSGLLALAVPLPILNRRQGEVDRTLGELGRHEATVQLIQRQIETDVATAYQQVVASRRISDAYTSRILPDQNRNFQMLREGYNIGQLSITDVLVGQRELIDAREAYLDAAAVLNAAAAALYRALNHTQIGQRVTKGQDRIEVQSVEVEKLELDLMQAENKYQAERAKLELDLTQAENKRRLAQTEADRNRSLVEKGGRRTQGTHYGGKRAPSGHQ
jgi:cobalt-zinc-cadmium efflux system outer membrane protein